MLNVKNLNQLKNKLKEIEGKAIFKLTRVSSLNDGEFLRILHKVRQKDIIFYDGEKEWHLEFPKANELTLIDNGFIIKNCTYELLQVKEA